MSRRLPQRDCRLDDAPDQYAEPTLLVMDHGRTLPRAGVESHAEIARAIASGDADQAAKATKRLLVYIEELARRLPVVVQ